VAWEGPTSAARVGSPVPGALRRAEFRRAVTPAGIQNPRFCKPEQGEVEGLGKGSGWIWAHIRSARKRATDPGHAGGRLSWVFFLAGRRRDPRPLDPLGAALDETSATAVELGEAGARPEVCCFLSTPRDARISGSGRRR